MREAFCYVLAFALAVFVAKSRTPLVLKIIWGYFILITAFKSMWPFYCPPFAPPISNILELSSARNLVMLLMVPAAMFSLSTKSRDLTLKILLGLLCVDALAICFDRPPFFEAKTFDATILGCFFLVWPRKKWWGKLGMAFFAYTIIHATSRDGSFVVAVSLFVLTWQYFEAEIFSLFFWASLVSAFGFGVYYLPHFMKDSRPEMWKNYMSWWVTNPLIEFDHGVGMGVFEFLGPYLPTTAVHAKIGVGFYIMHNDWLQTLFETGLIGLVALVVGFGYVAHHLRGKHLAMWVGVGAGMCFYYPLHAFPVQLLMLILITKAEWSGPEDASLYSR